MVGGPLDLASGRPVPLPTSVAESCPKLSYPCARPRASALPSPAAGPAVGAFRLHRPGGSFTLSCGPPTTAPGASMDLSLRVRLSALMFLQLFVWGAWGVVIFSFIGSPPAVGGLGFSGTMQGWIGSTL